MSYIAMCTTQKDSKCKTERERKGSSHTWYLAYWLDKAKLKCKNLWHFTVCYLWSTHIMLIIFTAVYFQHWLRKQSGCKDTMYYHKYYFCHTLIKRLLTWQNSEVKWLQFLEQKSTISIIKRQYRITIKKNFISD